MKQPSSFDAVRWFGAELFGTAVLAITVGSIALTYDSTFVPIFAGIMVALMVYTIGSVSGAHINPAISVAMAVFRQISLPRLLVHLAAQVAGAFLGFAVVSAMVGGMPSAPAGETSNLMIAEFVSAMILVFTVTVVVMKKVSPAVSGVAIGMAIMLAAAIGGSVGAGVFNPALALGLRSTSVTFLLVPLLGGLAGCAIASLLHPHADTKG